MKIVQILVLLATASTIAHAQQPPAPNPFQNRPQYASPECQRCFCCHATLGSFALCCIYQLIPLSDQARMHGEIKGLQATSYGRKTIEHLKQLGAQEAHAKIAKEFYQKGLKAGHTSCPTTPMMSRGEESDKAPIVTQIPEITNPESAYADYDTCFCPGSLSTVQVKKNK